MTQFLRHFTSSFVAACCLIGSAILSHALPPTDNPVASRYGPDAYPWSEELPWDAVFNILDYGGIADGSGANDTAYLAALDAATAAGGGVIYFPAGTYAFNDSIGLRDNIVLRGDNPSVTDAQNVDFRPPSQLVFPRFIFDPLANGGNGTDPSTAFKGISMQSGQAGRNVGVVNLDINRAWLYAGGGGSSSANVVVMGVRSNNVATRQSWTVPTPEQHPWQIHSNRFAYNISAFAFQNVLVANNRLNDAHYWVHRQLDGQSIDQPPADLGQLQIDDFTQPGYLVRHESNGSWIAVEDRFPGGQYVFSYTDHYGIRVTGSSGEWGAAPWIQPNLFYRYRAIRDNWVYTTMRTKIAASGTKLIIRDNILLDRRNKLHFVHPNGHQVVQNAATLENRGIDWRGHDVLIENNYIDVHRHRLRTMSGYPSVDGEGILHQEVHGTTIDGVTIRGNQTSSYIGIWKMPYTRNVLIEDNILGINNIGDRAYVYVHSNTNGRDFPMFNVVVRNNSAPGGVTLGAGYHAPGTPSARVEGNQVGADVRIEDHMVAIDNVTISEPPTAANLNISSGSVAIETPAEGILFADRDVESMQSGEVANITVLVTTPEVNVSRVNFYNYKTLIGTAESPPYTFAWTSDGSMPFLSAEIRQPDQPGNLRLYTALLPSAIPPWDEAPVISLSSPAATDALVAPATVVIAADVLAGAYPLERVEFYLDGFFIAAAPAAAPHTFTWEDAPRGTYSLTAKAWDERGAVVVSDPVVIFVDGLPDASPTDFTARAYSDTEILLEWDLQATNATGVRLERSPANAGTWQPISQLDASARSFMDTGLAPNSAFDYRLIATNAHGESAPSQPASATTFATQLNAPLAVTGLAAATLPGNRVEVTWQTPPGAFGTVIESRSDEHSPWQVVAQLPAAVSSFIDASLPAGTRAFYRVQAWNNAGTSDWAYTVGAVFDAPLAATFAAAGRAWPIPGRVEVEDYNPGGFYDTTEGNSGNSNYRAPDPVDISASGNNYTIGWIDNGEWLEYTIEVQQAGLYTIAIRYASPNSNGQLELLLNGTLLTPRITFANTGAWGTFTDHSINNVYLHGGMHILRLQVANSGFNLDYVDFALSEPATFAIWQATSMPDHPLALPHQDASGDGIANILKFLFGQDPLVKAASPFVWSIMDGATRLRFPVNKGLSAIQWQVESAPVLNDPDAWSPVPSTDLRLFAESPQAHWFEVQQPVDPTAHRFLRLRANPL